MRGDEKLVDPVRGPLSTGGLGRVALRNHGSYASPQKVRHNRSPGYSAQKYAMPAGDRPATSSAG